MNRLIVMILVVVTLVMGCTDAIPQNDNERVVRLDTGLVDVSDVTCWVVYDSISCLPDWFIRGESPER